MTRGVLLAILLASTSAQAGDYFLFVADSDTCSTSNPVASSYPSSAVAADLDRHFSGTVPEIDIFRAAFTNARISYCGSAERAVIEDSLVSWAVRGPTANESDLYDYFLMLGSRRLAEQIEAVLATEQPPDVISRLKRAELAVSRGQQLRSN